MLFSSGTSTKTGAGEGLGVIAPSFVLGTDGKKGTTDARSDGYLAQTTRKMPSLCK